MNPSTPVSGPGHTQRAQDATRRHVRGSTLLLAGKLLSTGINFGAQLLVVRHLAKSDYGAWAYALSVVTFCQSFATVGLDRGITRFVPIYQERSEYPKLFGTIVFVIGTVVLLGMLIVAAFLAAPGHILRQLTDSAAAVHLLAIVIFLVPIDALDNLLLGLFASFASPGAIFFRRYVIGPGLKLLVAGLLVWRNSTATLLAYGYVVSSLAGVSFYLWLFFKNGRESGLFRHWDGRLVIPAREILAFTLPLLSSDMLAILMNSVNTMLLGHYQDMKQVADFRVVLPLAAMNQLVMTSFGLLYTPAAARLYARDDMPGVNHLYWRSAVWLAVLSFPVFAITFCFARPLTVFLYGAQYAESGVILAILALAYYFNVALGFNGLTLKVLGSVRYIVVISVIAAVANLLINLFLIPRYGALGAAIGMGGTMILHNILKQAGLRMATGLSPFDREYSWFYLLITGNTIALLAIRHFTPENVYVAAAVTGVASLALVVASKRELSLSENFRELSRFPILQRLFT
jgi:O-antigen/teichoic acid export membrane protein